MRWPPQLASGRPKDEDCRHSRPFRHEGALLLGEGRPPLSTRRQAAVKALSGADCVALRESLHLNVAAAANREQDWDLAHAACRRCAHTAVRLV